jgi:type IV pilus assembly protein PilY1
MKIGLPNFWRWLLGVLLLTASAAHAADTDLFAGTVPNANIPNVLFVIDTGASFSASNSSFRCNIDANGAVLVDGTGLAANFTQLDKTNGGVEQCALYSVLKSLVADNPAVKVGFMFFNSGMATYDPLTNTWGNECSSGIGGCLAMKLTPLSTANATNILNYVRNWTTSSNGNYNIKAPANRGDGAAMQEAWAYFNGKTGVSTRDYSGIMPPGDCGGNNIIYLGNNYNTQASPKDATNSAGSPWTRFTGSAPTAQNASPAPDSFEQGNLGDTLTTSCGTQTLDGTNEGKGARALNWTLYSKNHGIKTTSIGILGPSCDALYGAQLTLMGKLGDGGFFGTTDFASLVLALKNAMQRIISVNSVFASVALPVSVNTQGSYLNRVYIGMFRPDAGFFPRWQGNLKQYKVGYNGSNLDLLDADNKGATNPLTGFIDECARSFWTPNVVDTYWALAPNSGCTLITGAKASNYPDGNIVEKGGQAYKLRSITPASRVVKTCSPAFASCTSLTNFDTGNSDITWNLLGLASSSATAPDAPTLINWARGQNTSDDLVKGTTAMRPSVHGDVMHSRPVAINYGTDNSPAIVVYYGAGDGMLHAINGNRDDPTSPSAGQFSSGGNTYPAGIELWAFMPPEFWGKIKRQYDNTVPVSYPSTISGNAQPKGYGIDGPITSYQDAGNTKVWVYAPMRRGGRALYAFDTTTPGSPSLKWKVGCPNLADDTGCTSGYSGIGQTWSSAKPIFATGYGSGTSPMLMMGGGYDNCEDYDDGTKNNNCTSSSKGNKVYVIDAATGAIVRAFDTDRGVIADLFEVRSRTDQMMMYAYTADLGGNVYRIDFVDPVTKASRTPAQWTIKKIASLGCDTLSACNANRKFMFIPSVVTDDNDVTFWVALGSGDREKPVSNYAASRSVSNFFFSLRDKPSDPNWTNDTANCGTGATTLCKASLYGITTTATPTDAQLATKPMGWYLALASTEQVVTSALTLYGVVTFSTQQPAVSNRNSCTLSLGTTNVYSVGYKNAQPVNSNSRFEHLAGDGLPSNPVGGVLKLDNGQEVTVCFSCSGAGAEKPKVPGQLASVFQPKNRLYWYIQK